MQRRTTLALLAGALAYTASAQELAQREPAAAERLAPNFLRVEAPVAAPEAGALVAAFAKANPAVAFRSVELEQDALGMTHERFQQTFNGLPVDGYSYTAHSRDGQVVTLSGDHASLPEDLATVPGLAAATALDGALRHLQLAEPMWASPDAPEGYGKPAGELVIYADPVTRAAALAYKFDVYTEAPLYRAWVYVDARSGAVLFEDSRIHHANAPVQAVSSYNGTVGITADLSGGTYTLKQTVSGGGVETRSLRNGTNYGSSVAVTDNATPFDSDPTAVQAHYGAEQTYDYFRVRHNRNSYNDAGGKLLSYVHYSRNYVNAFWDGSRMTYGDGDGTSYGPLTSIDIAGHEMTHGVTEYAAGLVYRNESGALNESFSDIFGEMVEFHATGTNDWQMGTDIGVNRSGAIRSMDNPNAFSDPDTYGGTYYYTGTGDNGGVHINSGVQNKWFHILTVGESATNDKGSGYAVTGIGRTKAAAIAYRNLDVYLTANSTYADARVGAIQAATDLYGAGSAEVIATTNAWYAVGVGAAYNGGGTPPTTDTQAPTTPASLTASNVAETTLDLTWTASTDNVGVTGYKVFAGANELGTTTGTSVGINELTPGTTYTFGVAAVDAAGNVSGTRSTTVTTSGGGGGTPGGATRTLLASFFETGYDGWVDGGGDAGRTRSSRSYEGSYSMYVRDNSGVASSIYTASGYDLRGATGVEVDFYFYVYSLEAGESLLVEYNSGAGWQTVASYVSGSSFSGDGFYHATATMSPTDFSLTASGKFRLRANASSNSDVVYLDQITLTYLGTSGATFASEAVASGQTCAPLGAGFAAGHTGFDEGDLAATLTLAPNPARDFLELTFDEEEPVAAATLYSATGQVVRALSADEIGGRVDVSTLAPGMYLLSVQATDGEAQTLRFVKQ